MDAGHALRNWVQTLHEFTALLVQSPWFGDALGSSVALLAILIGALYNAKLNRQRDRELHEEEVASLKVALGTELRCYSHTLAERAARIEQMSEEFLSPSGLKFKERLRVEPPTIYRALAHKVGLLPSEMAGVVVTAWHHFEVARHDLNAMAAELDDRSFNPKRLKKSSKVCYGASDACARAADKLLAHIVKRRDE